MIFNLPEYRVVSAHLLGDGTRRIVLESTAVPACPACGVVAERCKDRRLQRLRDIPVAGSVEVLWRKGRFFCDEPACPRGSFTETTDQVPRRATATGRLLRALVDAVVRSGRAVSEAASAHGVSWWLAQKALGAAAATCRTWTPWPRVGSASTSTGTGRCGSGVRARPRRGCVWSRG